MSASVLFSSLHSTSIVPRSSVNREASSFPAFIYFSVQSSESNLSIYTGKFEEVRQLYLDQIAGLENLHLQVKEGLEHLRSETDHLQRIDETIRKQRSALDATFQDFEQKQTLFREKGAALLFVRTV